MTDTIAHRAVLNKQGEDFQLEDVSLPQPPSGGLNVRIEMCTICGSDVHTIKGRRPLSGPMVLGHEILGRIVELPDTDAPICTATGTPLQLGDRITWSIHACCGACFWCDQLLTQKCDQLFKYGHHPASETLPLTGGFASHCQIQPGTTIVKVPSEMDARLACPVNCATATVAASFRQADACAGRCVVIFGAGMLGLTAAAWASNAGAASVVVVDPNVERADQALQFGATAVCNDVATAKSVVENATAGRGADISFDFCGHPDAALGTIHLLRIGGQAVLAGAVFPTESISLHPEMVVRRLLRISGVHNYQAQDLVAAVQFLQQVGDRFPLASLVAATYELSEIDRAVEHAAAGTAIRVAIR